MKSWMANSFLQFNEEVLVYAPDLFLPKEIEALGRLALFAKFLSGFDMNITLSVHVWSVVHTCFYH